MEIADFITIIKYIIFNKKKYKIYRVRTSYLKFKIKFYFKIFFNNMTPHEQKYSFFNKAYHHRLLLMDSPVSNDHFDHSHDRHNLVVEQLVVDNH